MDEYRRILSILNQVEDFRETRLSTQETPAASHGCLCASRTRTHRRRHVCPL
ncbi:MAG: hypothetical protein C4576_35625 [Desulfobacteraceae bacterium]|nr:MAG: hypothetical protein C4576_35625 [Desulfobacteraceae bacterium]